MRRRHWLVLLPVLLAAGWFWQRSRGRADFANYPPAARGDWVAFGDSLTSGYGAEGQGYPEQLAKQLGVVIHNLGVPGDTTADGLARLEGAAQLQPRVALLCLGGNDALQRLPAAQTFANLGRMIDRFHQAGSFVVLLGVRSAGLTDQNAKRFRELAREKRVLLVPNILDGVLFTPSLMFDQVHPNVQGHGKIATRVAGALALVRAGL